MNFFSQKVGFSRELFYWTNNMFWNSIPSLGAKRDRIATFILLHCLQFVLLSQNNNASFQKCDLFAAGAVAVETE